MKNAERLIKFLSENKETLSPLLILTHDYPDPDALASAVALQYVAEKGFGIQSRIAYSGIVGRTENRAMISLLKLPVHQLRKSDLKKYSRVALVDTQPAFENNSFPRQRKASIVIDQHASDKKPTADFSIVDTSCGATSVILSRAVLQFQSEIPSRVATALAYGILSDTLNLLRVKERSVIETYMCLLPYCDLITLAKIQNPTRSRRFFSTLSRGIHSTMGKRGLLISHLGNVENPDLVSQTAEFLLTYRSSKWALCTGRYHGKLHASLRMERGMTGDAGEIMRDIFLKRGLAGGHGSIAGGSMKIGKAASEETWQEAEQSLVTRLVKRLRIPAKAQFNYPFKKD